MSDQAATAPHRRDGFIPHPGGRGAQRTQIDGAVTGFLSGMLRET
jgi:hypothetical protein